MGDEKKLKPGELLVEVVSGAQGPCLCIGDYNSGERVAGPKPWGGGQTIHRFVVSAADLVRLSAAYGATP